MSLSERQKNWDFFLLITIGYLTINQYKHVIEQLRIGQVQTDPCVIFHKTLYTKLCLTGRLFMTLIIRAYLQRDSFP